MEEEILDEELSMMYVESVRSKAHGGHRTPGAILNLPPKPIRKTEHLDGG